MAPSTPRWERQEGYRGALSFIPVTAPAAGLEHQPPHLPPETPARSLLSRPAPGHRECPHQHQGSGARRTRRHTAQPRLQGCRCRVGSREEPPDPRRASQPTLSAQTRGNDLTSPARHTKKTRNRRTEKARGGPGLWRDKRTQREVVPLCRDHTGRERNQPRYTGRGAALCCSLRLPALHPARTRAGRRHQAAPRRLLPERGQLWVGHLGPPACDPSAWPQTAAEDWKHCEAQR